MDRDEGRSVREVWGCLLVLALLATSSAACGGRTDGGAATATASPGGAATAPASPSGSAAVSLPSPRTDGEVPLEEALARRRSVRDFTAGALTLRQVAQLLWAAQGVSDPAGGRRTAPSAGGLYPLQVYAAVRRVTALAPGVYRYVPASHSLERVREGSVAATLAEAALSQQAVAEAPVTLAVAAGFSRTTGKYGERGRRYVVLEAGHAAQNVCLQAVALGLGAVPIGAFSDADAARVLGLPRAETLLYLVPVGEPDRP